MILSLLLLLWPFADKPPACEPGAVYCYKIAFGPGPFSLGCDRPVEAVYAVRGDQGRKLKLGRDYDLAGNQVNIKSAVGAGEFRVKLRRP